MRNTKKGQVWVETAIYTLIGLTVIAIVLSIATPQISKLTDKNVVEKSSEILQVLNNEIEGISGSLGNRRIIDIKIGKGKIEINGEEDKIKYLLDNSRLIYSEPDIQIEENGINILTTRSGSKYEIILEKDYNGKFNIEIADKLITLQKGEHKIQIENIGNEFNALPIIEIKRI